MLENAISFFVTVSANHDINAYLPLLAKNGIIVELGAAPAPHSIS